jgi:hypothetical protein
MMMMLDRLVVCAEVLRVWERRPKLQRKNAQRRKQEGSGE